MKRLGRISLSLACLAIGTGSATTTAAGPIDFLRRVGYSITHPHKKEVARHPVRKSSGRHSSSVAKDDAPDGQDFESGMHSSQEPPPAPAPGPSATNPPTPTPAPTVRTERAAVGVPASRTQRTDLPYGVPVPNRPGLVVSPYSPNGGYVDTRDIPSGTPVKDPYTGKIFLTP